MTRTFGAHGTVARRLIASQQRLPTQGIPEGVGTKSRIYVDIGPKL
jgi:hypothetical protein